MFEPSANCVDATPAAAPPRVFTLATVRGQTCPIRSLGLCSEHAHPGGGISDFPTGGDVSSAPNSSSASSMIVAASRSSRGSALSSGELIRRSIPAQLGKQTR